MAALSLLQYSSHQKPKNGRWVHRQDFQYTFKGELICCEKSWTGDKNWPCPQLAMEAMKEIVHGPESRPAAHWCFTFFSCHFPLKAKRSEYEATVWPSYSKLSFPPTSLNRLSLTPLAPAVTAHVLESKKGQSAERENLGSTFLPPATLSLSRSICRVSSAPSVTRHHKQYFSRLLCTKVEKAATAGIANTKSERRHRPPHGISRGWIEEEGKS